MAGKKGSGSKRDGGYIPGGRPQGGGGNPRLTDGAGPSDPVYQNKSDFEQAMPQGRQESFKSPENQSNSSMAGVRDTASGEIRQLKRSTPAAGVYQGGNNDRGGAATKSYDSSTDGDLEIVPSHYEELRAHQDGAAGRAGKKDD